MELKAISPRFTVSAQLSPADIVEAARLGYQAIINNRPDGEGEDQPTSRQVGAEAESQGLTYHHVPVAPGRISETDIDAFKAALEGASGPVLAFCRTGTRSATLWALSQAGRASSQALIQAAADAGYDLSELRARLDARALGVS